MNPHTTSDDASRYRAAEELESWAQRDPIARVRTYLERSTEIDPEFFASVEEEAEKLALRFRAEVRGLPDASFGSVFDNAYTNMPPELAQQRADLTGFVASLE